LKTGSETIIGSNFDIMSYFLFCFLFKNQKNHRKLLRRMAPRRKRPPHYLTLFSKRRNLD